MKILIDNGHGENTPGKRSPDGVFREFLYAREIADDVVCELKSRGFDAERIVRENIDVRLQDRVQRVNQICNECGAKNVILVSIHCNAAGSDGNWHNATGWAAYTTKGKTKADNLADFLYAAAEKCFPGKRIRKDMSDGDPDWEENFYILKNTKCPAVLTENFFQDNKEDVSYLLSLEGRKSITRCHADGIVNYINSL